MDINREKEGIITVQMRKCMQVDYRSLFAVCTSPVTLCLTWACRVYTAQTHKTQAIEEIGNMKPAHHSVLPLVNKLLCNLMASSTG